MHPSTLLAVAAAISIALAAPAAMPPVGDEIPRPITSSATPVDPIWSIGQNHTTTLKLPAVTLTTMTMIEVISTKDEHDKPTLTTSTTVVSTCTTVTRTYLVTGPVPSLSTPTPGPTLSPSHPRRTVTKTFTVRNALLPSPTMSRRGTAGDDEVVSTKSEDARAKDPHQPNHGGSPFASYLPAGLGKPRVCHY